MAAQTDSTNILRKRAALHMLATSALFLVAYGGVNWLTSLRHDVGTCYATWELRIPLVPWMLRARATGTATANTARATNMKMGSRRLMPRG